jgi:collagen beta-1,O-galactosyltransferase
MLDSDTFFVNNQTLHDLTKRELTVVAPMLRSDGLYSNFWCGMSEDFYYIRTDDYKPILYREKIGCFQVPMVHSAVLINLRHKASQHLTYIDEQIPEYDGPEDDIITFALGAKYYGKYYISLYLCYHTLIILDQSHKF